MAWNTKVKFRIEWRYQHASGDTRTKTKSGYRLQGEAERVAYTKMPPLTTQVRVIRIEETEVVRKQIEL